MKKIATIAAVAALTTLAACGDAEAPAEAVATEAAPLETAPAADAPALDGATDGAIAPKEVSEENPAAPAAQ